MIAQIKRLMLVFALVITTQPAVSQGLFDAKIHVDDTVVTVYEINQRVRLLRALGAEGIPGKDPGTTTE